VQRCYRALVLSLVGFPPSGRTLPFLACIVAALGLAFGGQGCRNFFTQIDDSRRLAADLRLQFNQASDASNRAVMADTDEASVAFAGEAEEAVQIVESDVAALMPLLRSLRLSNEIQLLEQFGKHFAEYRELDRTILTLAVENTNLKAQRLAFGPAQEAANSFRDSLGLVASSVPPKDRCSVEGLVAKATLAVREIQVLHAPHIAEASDAAMASMEQEMANLAASAKAAVVSLTELAPRPAQSALTSARSALDRFEHTSRQILALSRRNSNVRSLQLSLREKPALTAACDQSLRALEDLLAKEDVKATR
jgi:hypothetical protein